MSNTAALWILLLFLILNSIKVTLFNQYVLGEWESVNILHRFVYTILYMTLICIGLNMSSKTLLAGFYIIQAAYIAICLSYANFYHYVLHLLQGLKLIRESFNAALHKSVPRYTNQLIAIIDLPVFILFFMIYEKSTFSIISLPCEKYIISAGIISIIAMEIINYFKGQSIIQLIKTYPESELLVIANYGTLVNILVDLCKFHRYDKIVKQYDYGKPETLKGTALNMPNIIIIQMESLDSNSINLCHDGGYVMPYLHSLTEKSIYYPYTMNYHKAGGTSDAEFSIINSVEPLSNFPSIKIPSYDYVNSFVRLLSDNSYDTAAFHGNDASYYRRNHAFSNMGFDKFYDIEEMNLKEVGWGAPDHEVFNYAMGKIEQQGSPFFDYIITMSNHCRFTNALNYYHNESFDNIENIDVRNFYNSLSYIDVSLGSFVEKVRDLDRDTYIIILGDHTAGLKKNIYDEASIKLENRHLEFVPLIIITPDGISYKENEKVASFLDIAPTVLELANIHSEYHTYGQSLIERNDIGKKIPYRGYFFDRKQLYKEMEKHELA